VLLCESDKPPVTRLEHANYLGRELQRAEFALVTGDEYVQD
jgi:dihydropteroate synthase